MGHISLEMTSCFTGNTYIVKFLGEDAEDKALEFFDKKKVDHAISEAEGDFIDQGYGRIIEKLYPTCIHGMSEWLCEDPVTHYPRYM